MAILKKRLLRKNEFDEYDIIHLETSMDDITTEDGSSLTETMTTVTDKVTSVETTVTDLQETVTAINEKTSILDNLPVPKNASCRIIGRKGSTWYSDSDCDYLCDGTNDTEMFLKAAEDNAGRKFIMLIVLPGSYNITQNINFTRHCIIQGISNPLDDNPTASINFNLTSDKTESPFKNYMHSQPMLPTFSSVTYIDESIFLPWTGLSGEYLVIKDVAIRGSSSTEMPLLFSYGHITMDHVIIDGYAIITKPSAFLLKCSITNCFIDTLCVSPATTSYTSTITYDKYVEMKGYGTSMIAEWIDISNNYIDTLGLLNCFDAHVTGNTCGVIYVCDGSCRINVMNNKVDTIKLYKVAGCVCSGNIAYCIELGINGWNWVYRTIYTTVIGNIINKMSGSGYSAGITAGYCDHCVIANNVLHFGTAVIISKTSDVTNLTNSGNMVAS